jgi:hypothetical protein|tara:strand:- start:1442 stop:1702 length:261 start_codon:yes stop_codon:yes gene_type:complete
MYHITKAAIIAEMNNPGLHIFLSYHDGRVSVNDARLPMNALVSDVEGLLQEASTLSAKTLVARINTREERLEICRYISGIATSYNC